MRLLLSCFLVVFYCTTGEAQLVFDINRDIIKGNSFLTVLNSFPKDINLEDPGPNQTWNFSSLTAPMVKKSSINRTLSASVLANFPVGTLSVTKGASTSIYSTANNVLTVVGTVDYDPLGLGLQKEIVYKKPFNQYVFPMIYGESYEGDGSFEIILNKDEIPQDLLKVLPITPTKLKISNSIEFIADLDAFGSLKLPNHNYTNVLREKRIETLRTKFEIQIGFFGWLDVSRLYSDFKEIGTFEPFKRTIYNYWKEGESVPLVSLWMNKKETTIEKIEYRTDAISALDADVIQHEKPEILAYPNPAISHVQFELMNLQKGKYTVQIMNVIGQTIWTKKINFIANTSVQIDLSEFNKGAYLYSLIDEYGKTISTKRLMVLKP